MKWFGKMVWDFTFTVMAWDFLILAVPIGIIGLRLEKQGDEALSKILIWISLSLVAIYFTHMAPQMLERITNKHQ